jgi:RNA polymerase sigma-70 factor, ECF subfamily
MGHSVCVTSLPARSNLPASPPEPPSIDRLRGGDPEALTHIYRRHAAGLLALAYRLTGSAADAEDVVQDLFVGLPEALARYREEGRFGGWLRSLVVRLCLMRLRTARRRREVDLDHIGPVPAGPARDQDAWSALAELPEDQRVIVVLKVVEGYSHAEIAELLGIRRGTSEVRLHRALRRLRTRLEES